VIPYVELRCKSAFSFLTGTALPEELATCAAALGYTALALTDSGGLYGTPRFAKAAQQAGVRPICGAEVSVDGHPLLLLCENAAGYRNLCRLLTREKMRPRATGADAAPLTVGELEAYASGLIALSGGAEGRLGTALDRKDSQQAARTLDELLGVFGPRNLAVELQVHLDEQEDRRNAALLALASTYQVPLVLTNDVRMTAPDKLLLCDVLTCVREGVTLAAAGTHLLRNAERHLKSPSEMAALLPELPAAVAYSAELAARCRFTLADLGYKFPDFPLPPGDSQHDFLRAITFDAAPARFRPYTDRARAQLERELVLIAKLGLSGYFLIVWDIIQFCKSRGILVQGRGSAANSAVCFALGITACDPLKMDLLFERFLSEERGEWPDIDLDLPSGSRREEVIQYLYRKYGAHGCALTAVVISYRGRSAVRDIGKVLGLDPEVLDKLSAQLSHYEDPAAESEGAAAEPADEPTEPAPPLHRQLARAGLALAGRDYSIPGADAPLQAGMTVKVVRVREDVQLKEDEIPFETEAQVDPELPLGETQVLRAGENGLVRRRIVLTYENGRLINRQVAEEERLKEPVSQQIRTGSKVVWRTVETEQGPMRYFAQLRVYATSYSAARAGTPKSAPWYGRTRMGLVMRKGIVAVDRRLIPLGTNLYVPGYGVGLAGDTGGGIKNFHIDLGYDDDNYVSWHQWVELYLLEPVPSGMDLSRLVR
jgi:3D (Asp-Asp-Asp) domain-containing protein